MLQNRAGRIATVAAVVVLGMALAGCDTGSPAGPTPNAAPTATATHVGMSMDATPTRDAMQSESKPTATHGGMSVEPTATGGVASFAIKDDLEYIEMMVPHHQLAVDMGKLAQEKATHAELKGLANDIILTQEDEVRRMNLWREELGGGPTATPDPDSAGGHDAMEMPGMDVDLEQLASSPTFDLDFIRAMIPHHQSAIDMSRAALPNLKHEALRDLAQDIITTQQVEIDRMRGWLEHWK